MCGPERRLVEDVVDAARRAVDTEDQAWLSAATESASTVWAELNTTPVGERRFVLVRDAEYLQNWFPFLDWLTVRSSTHVCFVSGETKTDTSTDHLQAIIKKGRYVRCGPFAREDDQVAVLQVHGNVGSAEARYLLRRVGGRMSSALDCLAKCSYFGGGSIPMRVIEAVTVPAPQEDFIGSLLAFQRGPAMEAAGRVSPSDYGSVVAILDFKVDVLGRLCRALRRSRDMREVMKSTRFESYVVKDLLPYARRYDREQVRASVEALAYVDARISEGENDLVLETLASLWGLRG